MSIALLRLCAKRGFDLWLAALLVSVAGRCWTLLSSLLILPIVLSPVLVWGLDRVVWSASTAPIGAGPVQNYPVGWYVLLNSNEVDSTPQKRLFCGREWVVYRTDGKIVVMNSECPHMGADLSAGRVLPNGQIQCPYHGWRFDAEGKCAHVPTCASPPNAAQTTLRTREQDGLVYAWNASSPPNWTPERFGLDASNVSEGYVDVNQSVRTIVENSHDVGHLKHVHGVTYEDNAFFSVQWSVAQPVDSPTKKQIKIIGSQITLRSKPWFVRWTNTDLPVVVRLRVEHHGPAVWRIPMEIDIMGRWNVKCTVVQQQIPMGDSFQTRNVTRVYASNPLLRVLVLFVTLNEILTDNRIWKDAGFKTRGRLWSGLPNGNVGVHDRKISEFRRWFGQFKPKDRLEW